MSIKKLSKNEVRERVYGVPFFYLTESLDCVIRNLNDIQKWLELNGWYDGEIVDDGWADSTDFCIYATRKKTQQELDREKEARKKARATKIANKEKKIAQLEKELAKLKGGEKIMEEELSKLKGGKKR